MEDSDCFSLIDENDSLISPDAEADADDASLTNLHSGDIGGERVDEMDLSNKCGEQFPQLVKTTEPQIPRKTGKLNLRKSLAWNSAFFESPGFLDPEEISTMIGGAEKGKKHLLPGIDEDISRSTESFSTLASETLALESLEDELFKDIRASIQKSSKASSTPTSNNKAAPKEMTDKLVKSSVKKVEITSRNGIARNVTSKRQAGGVQGSRSILKKDSSPTLVTKPGLRNGNSSSSLAQPPKAITKPEAMPVVTTKKAFLGANRIKTETNNLKVGSKGVQVHVPLASGLAGPQRSVPKPPSLPKASGPASSGATIKEVGRSSCSSNGSKSTSTEKIQKSTLMSARTMKISRPVVQASSKIPLSKKPPGRSGPPSSLTSSKISSSISPSSSISEWSSASSSSSTVNRRLASRTNIDTDSSCRSTDNETPSVLCSDVQLNDSISDVILNQLKESPCQDVKKKNVQNNLLSRSDLMKPSGLRMPSPKIGFFDGAKSMVQTPNACRQSQLRLPTGLPKLGAAIRSPVGSSKKAGDIPSGKKAISGANTVLNTSKSASPRPSQESSRASMKGRGDSRSVSSPDISSEARSSNEGTGKPWSKMTLTSTNTELEDQKSDSSEPFQESAAVGGSLEQPQSCFPTGFAEIDASICNPIRSSKKEGKILTGDKATAVAVTVLDTSKSAPPTPSQESLRASMEGHGDTKSVSSPNISSEMVSTNKETGKPWLEMTLTNTNIELEGKKSDSPKPFQESAYPGVSQEQSQTQVSTCLPKIQAAIHSLVGSSKKAEGNIPAGKKTSGANTVLDMSESATPEPSQESSGASLKGHGDHLRVSSPDISSEGTSSDEVTGKPCSEVALTSTNIEPEIQNFDSSTPFQEIACPGVSQEQSQPQLPTCLPKIEAASHNSPVGSSKKAGGNIPAGEKSSVANTVVVRSESATPDPSKESMASMKVHGDHRSVLSPDISSEATCSDKVTKKPCSELTLTSTNIEPEGQKSKSLKPFQESACPGVSQEQSQPQSPTCLPKIKATIHNPVGSLKKAEGNIPDGKKTSGANTVLDMSESATPEPSQESSGASLKGHGDHMSVSSPDISSEGTSSDEVTGKPCSELTLTSTNIEPEIQNFDSSTPFQEIACPGVSQEQSQPQLPTCLPKTKAASHSPVGSSKKAGGNIPAGEKSSVANTVVVTSESATPDPSKESMASMKGHGDHRSVLSPDISSEATCSDEVTKKPCLELTLTSTNIEPEGQKSESLKPFQESACPGVSQPQSPTCLPKIEATIHNPVGSSKKADENIPDGKKSSSANTVLDTLESATPEPSQESRASMKDHVDHKSLLSPGISSEALSSDEVTRKPCSELTLTSTNLELEGQTFYFPKLFQESASFGMSLEHQPYLPTGLPIIGAAICNPDGSWKKEEGKVPDGEKATAGANTVPDTSESATPKPFQESSKASMKGHGDPWKLSPGESSVARTSNMGSGKPWCEVTLTSMFELEGQKSNFPKLYRESASPDASPEILSEIDRSNCVMTENVKNGKHGSGERATSNVPGAENNENLLLNI